MSVALTPEQQDKWSTIHEQRIYIINTLVRLGIPSQEAEDCLSSALLKTMRRNLSNPLPDNPVAYLVRAAKNEFLNTIRSSKQFVPLSEISTKADLSLESSVDSRLLAANIDRILSHPTDREVVFGHYIFGFSSAEQAQKLRVKPTAVRVRRLRAVRKVRRKLQIK